MSKQRQAGAGSGQAHGAGEGADDGLAALSRALRLVRARVAADITAQRLAIFIAVARHEGLSQRELLGRLEGTTITALSRNLADLSAFSSRKTPGPGLVELRTDPMNLRVKRVYLTRRGKCLLRDLERALAPEAGAQESA